MCLRRGKLIPHSKYLTDDPDGFTSYGDDLCFCFCFVRDVGCWLPNPLVLALPLTPTPEALLIAVLKNILDRCALGKLYVTGTVLWENALL